MKVDNEYQYAPSMAEVAVATKISNRVTPTPKVEFIAQPAAMWDWTTTVMRIANPITGKYDDFDAEMTLKNPQVTLNDLPRLGFVLLPGPPAPTRLELHPDTGIPALPPGYVMTPFGPSKVG